jgi:hypothetical protein
MGESLSDQLAALTGRGKPKHPKKSEDKKAHKPSQKPTSQLKKEKVSHQNSISYILNRIDRHLAQVSNDAKGVDEALLLLGYALANYGGSYLSSEDNTAHVTDTIAQFMDPDTFPKQKYEKLLLGAAALVSTNKQKSLFLQRLVDLVVMNRVDIKLRLIMEDTGYPKLGIKSDTFENDGLKYLFSKVGRQAFGDEWGNAEKAAARKSALEAAEKKKRVELARKQERERIDEEERAKTGKAVRQSIQDDIENLFESLTQYAAEVKYHVGEITLQDIKLILAWDNQSTDDLKIRSEGVAPLFERLRAYDVGRLVSARLAELAVLDYFKSLGNEVQDISITQLSRYTDDWKTHDIVAGGVPFDVKNARTSFSSQESYSEHFVSMLKTSYREGSSVRIIGVISDYKTEIDLRSGDFGEATILGEVDKGDVEALRLWLSQSFGSVLQLGQVGLINFVPGWMFEYPKAQQPNRTIVVDRIPKIIEKIAKAGLAHDTPKWLIALGEMDPRQVLSGLSSVELEICGQLKAVEASLGFSRRTLFLLILGVTLVMAKKGESDYRPTLWRSWLYVNPGVNSKAYFHPLGLLDTQQYIKNLIIALEVMWECARDRLAQFRRFKLAGSYILQGEGEDGHWYTILAYCGGWKTLPNTKVRCGKNPIYLGDSDSCELCHRLICPDCGFCGSNCPANPKRQEAYASIASVTY